MVYTGCRYCLTTNIIFGFTNQSQCKKCKRILSITLDISSDTSSGNSDLDGFLYDSRLNCHNKITEIIDDIKIMDLRKMYDYIREKYISQTQLMIKWIPYSRIIDVNEIARGGFGTIYCAQWINDAIYNAHRIHWCSGKYTKTSVVLKRFENSQNFSR